MNKETEDFLRILAAMLADDNYCLLPVSEYKTVLKGKKLLGYYDREHLYIIPKVIISAADKYAKKENKPKFKMRKILRQLFAVDLIKVHWIMTKEIRYRPQKRIGKTRCRYITFYRGQL